MEKKYYVYEWYIVNTGEIFHVGKGSKNRMHSLEGRNDYFMRIYNKYNCDVRIYKGNLSNDDACNLEKQRIRELKVIGQARTNFHEGGIGGNTFKYLPKENMDVIRHKIGIESKHKWENPIVRDKIVTSIRNAMSDSKLKEEISRKTKEAMHRPEVTKHLRDKIAQPIILIYTSGKVLEFEIYTDFQNYVIETYDVSARIPRYMKDKTFYHLSKRLVTEHKGKRGNLEELEGALTICKRNLLECVTTRADECKSVQQRLALLEVRDSLFKDNS